MDPSIWFYFVQSSPVVKLVVLVLLSLSVLSWTVIIQRWWVLRREQAHINDFENEFWGSDDLIKMYNKHNSNDYMTRGINGIFVAGVKEFIKLRKLNQPYEQMMDAVIRAMQIERAQIEQRLQQHLGFLASVGSISPYIGLLGTVWGIMTSFQALGHMKQATINLVAPGISEALIATALGLFAAIPAVWAFNYFSNHFLKLNDHYENYQAQLLNILNRQTNFK